MVGLVVFGDQSQRRYPRAGGEHGVMLQSWEAGATGGEASRGTTPGQPEGGDAPAGFGLSNLWMELKDEE